MKKSRVIIVSTIFVALTILLYAERIKLRTIQHRPVGGFEKFETLGDATIETATLGKNATSGTEIKLTENMSIGSKGTNTTSVVEKDLIIYGTSTIKGNVVAYSSVSVTGGGDSSFQGTASFNDGLTVVGKDVVTSGGFDTTTLIGSSVTMDSISSEANIEGFKTDVAMINDRILPTPSGAPTWQNVTYSTEAGSTSNSEGQEAKVTVAEWSGYTTENDCNEHKGTDIGDLGVFCGTQVGEQTCTDYYVEPIDRVYSFETILSGGSSCVVQCASYTPFGSCCNNDPSEPYRIDEKNGGCPTHEYTGSSASSTCGEACEEKKGSTCSESELDDYYLYTDSTGCKQEGFDAGDWDSAGWWASESGVDLIDSYDEDNYVYFNVDYSTTYYCPATGTNDALYSDYKDMLCLPERGQAYKQTIQCNIVQVGSTTTIKVLGW